MSSATSTIQQIEDKLEKYEKEYLDQNESMCNRIKQYALNEENYLNQINCLKNQLLLFQNENMQILDDSNNLKCQYESLKIEYQRLIDCFNEIQKNYEELRCKYMKMEENYYSKDNYELLCEKFNNVKIENDNKSIKTNSFKPSK
jgi:chromosome segregation ATPase